MAEKFKVVPSSEQVSIMRKTDKFLSEEKLMREEVFKGKLSGLDVIIEKDEYGAFWLKTTQKEDHLGNVKRIDGNVVFPNLITAGEEIEFDFRTKEELEEQLIKEGYDKKDVEEFLFLMERSRNV